jgi:hypothetical protein
VDRVRRADAAAGRLSEHFSTVSIHDIVLGAVDDEPIEPAADVIGRAYHYYGKGIEDLAQVKRRPNEFAIWRDMKKLIITPQNNRHEYFDLAADPGERKNLGLEPAKRSPLYGRLRRWLEEAEVSPPRPSREAREAQRETFQQLQELGYTREE